MSEKKIPYKIYLEESEMPKTWYKCRADIREKTSQSIPSESGNIKPMTEEEIKRCILRGISEAGIG